MPDSQISLNAGAAGHPRVAISLVNTNRKADTLECLQSILTLEDKDICVIVSDNASSDGSVEAFADWGRANLRCDRQGVQVTQRSELDAIRLNSFLTIVEIGDNFGFAFANNVAIRAALAQPSIEAVWILNNDTEVEPGSLSALRRRLAENPRIGICGSTLIYLHDKCTVQAVAVHYELAQGFGYQVGQGLTLDKLPSREQVEKEMTYVPGASMLVSREFLTTVGLMEENYFLYCEELDWSLRGRGRFDLGWAPDSIVFHKEGATIGTNSAGRASDRSIYYQNVNVLRVTWRFARVYLPFAIFRVAARGARFLVRKDPAGFRAIAFAMGDFLRNRYRKGGGWLSASRPKSSPAGNP
jgi:GT2 family glycosyltransferase